MIVLKRFVQSIYEKIVKRFIYIFCVFYRDQERAEQEVCTQNSNDRRQGEFLGLARSISSYINRVFASYVFKSSGEDEKGVDFSVL